MKTKIYVKKIWSLNPSQYKFISLDLATDNYAEYIESCVNAGYKKWKTFDKWLRTEI